MCDNITGCSSCFIKKGVLSRAYEAILVLIMITVVVLGIVWVADSLTVHFKTLSFYFKV